MCREVGSDKVWIFEMEDEIGKERITWLYTDRVKVLARLRGARGLVRNCDSITMSSWGLITLDEMAREKLQSITRPGILKLDRL